MKKYLLILLIFAFKGLNAQYTTVGNGAFASFVFGPTYTTTGANVMSRYAYIYPFSLLGDLKQGDSITGLSFFKENLGAVPSNANMIIHIRPTIKDDFGTGSINWNNELQGVGFKKVYDKNPVNDIGSDRGFIYFGFDTAFLWDTTFGKNLEVLVQYSHQTSLNASINWRYDNSNSVSGYANNQVKYNIGFGTSFPDTTVFSDNRRPQLKIHYPRYGTEMEVVNLYTLGKIPVPLGNPDTVKVIIDNIGKNEIINHKAYLYSRGGNQFVDSVTFSINAFGRKWVQFPLRNITDKGVDTLTVILAPDGDTTNNRIQGLRLANDFTYSYRNIDIPPSAGGIGFNGSTGDFVAKFNASQNMAINQISVTFGIANRTFKIGIWNDSGSNGKPGNLLWESDTQTATTTEFMLPVWPAVSVSGSFFVGVRQIETTNVAFGYQIEDPVRPGTFFYAAPLGDTNWVDFSPGAPFKFLIEPNIQAENDVQPISFDHPLDTLIFGTFDTMAPKATIRNIGSKDQLIPFETTCIIRTFFGQIAYTSSVFDTLSSGQNRQLTFDSSFYPTTTGIYTVDIITKLNDDQFKSNDTLRSELLVGRYNDVGPTTVFEPDINGQYQLNVDTLLMAVKVDNYGFNQTAMFQVRANIYDSTGNIVWTDVEVISLQGVYNTTVPFQTPYACNQEGTFTFECFTRLVDDTRRQNDTVRRFFTVSKNNDVAPDSILLPFHNQSISDSAIGFLPRVRIANLGLNNQTTAFPVMAVIKLEEQEVYRDTIMIQVLANNKATVSFLDSFHPVNQGKHFMTVTTLLPNDQLRENDTLTISFNVGVKNEIEILNVISPESDSVLLLENVYAPAITITQRGFAPITNPFSITATVYDSAMNQLYFSQKMITVNSMEVKTIKFDSSWLAQPLGIVSLVVNAELIDNGDTVASEIQQNYLVIKQYDAAIGSLVNFNSGDSVLIRTGALELEVEIENKALFLIDDIPVTLEIYDPQGSLIYNRSVISNPQPGNPDTITFPAFVPANIGNYSAKVICVYFKDQNRENDTMEFEIYGRIKYDFASMLFLNPQSMDSIWIVNQSSITPSVRFASFGDEPMSSGKGFFEIQDINNQSVYLDSAILSIASSSSEDIDFAEWIFNSSIQQPEYYSILSWVQLEGDQVSQNDTIKGEFYLSPNVSIIYVDFSHQINIYPIPFTSYLKVSFHDIKIDKLDMTDASGRKVLFKNIFENDSEVEINTTELAAGVYYLNLYSGNQIFARKVVKL
jgi:hypothetical protein